VQVSESDAQASLSTFDKKLHYGTNVSIKCSVKKLAAQQKVGNEEVQGTESNAQASLSS
jgi:hypothetical protein